MTDTAARISNPRDEAHLRGWDTWSCKLVVDLRDQAFHRIVDFLLKNFAR